MSRREVCNCGHPWILHDSQYGCSECDCESFIALRRPRILAILVGLFLTVSAHADEAYFNRVVNAIYWAEGGAKAQYPYGIRSVRTSDPRRVCYNSVRNNFRRWERAGRPGDFITFMGARYCPPTAHPLNRNWARNVQRLMR